jgi:hypothetical protein
MKKLFFIFIVLLGFINLNAQSYDKKIKVVADRKFDREISDDDKISITSYITRQNILTYANQRQVEKTVSDLPKYRYELVLVSESIYNGKLTKTWIYNAKVFINDSEVTKEQFPDGFTAIIENEPTIIYWYVSSQDVVDIKITWRNSIYFIDNK